MNKKVIGVIIFLAVVISVAIGALAYQNSSPVKLRKQLDLGNRYLLEENYERAIVEFTLAIQIDPQCPDAYLGLADTYIGMGDYESAKSALKKGIEVLNNAGDTDGASQLQKKLDEVQILLNENTEQVEEEQYPDEKEQSNDKVEPLLEEETDVTRYDTSYLNVPEGSIVVFGTYEQDGDFSNGPEPIEWYVLDNSENEVKLLSVYNLDAVPYNEDYVGVTWENCSLRLWLNDYFYNVAFDEGQQAVIKEENVINSNNPLYGTSSGKNTSDKVYLLSLVEIETYFGIPTSKDTNPYWNGILDDNNEYAQYCYNQDNRIIAKNTNYAIANGIDNNSNGAISWDSGVAIATAEYAIGSGIWWLRTIGGGNDNAAIVYFNGFIGNNSAVNSINIGVRPVINIEY